MTVVEWWRAFDQCTAHKIVEKMKEMCCCHGYYRKYGNGNILHGLLALFWHCSSQHENALIKVVDAVSWPADRVSLDQQVMTTRAKGWSACWLWNGVSFLCSTVEVVLAVFFQVVSSSPTPLSAQPMLSPLAPALNPTPRGAGNN